MTHRGFLYPLALLALLASLAVPLPAATYLPLSDADLARRSPVILHASVIAQESRLETVDGERTACTLTTLRLLETLKGSMAGETFQVELPGGRADSVATWVPGMPSFAVGSEVVLFLAPVRWRQGDFSLTELGLSKFDILEDAAGRRFVVRPAFSPQADAYLSGREQGVSAQTAVSAGAPQLRDADSFLSSLRSARRRADAASVEYALPRGELRRAGSVLRPLWVNIGGPEGSGNLFRWFWDSGLSPNALVSTAGAQTGLTDGSNGAGHVQNAVTQWSAVAGTLVRYSSTSGTGPVVINLDVDSKPPAWTGSLDCRSGGTIGYGGPGSSSFAGTFKGDSGYFAPGSGNVWMRRVTGGCYSAATFRSAVLHEMGHTLGLGHPDQLSSNHSALCAAPCGAVMTSVLSASRPDTPQADDVQAIQWYYGTGSAGSPPAASFSALPSAAPGQTILFTDTSTGSPSSWSWSFGDGFASVAQNPSHAYAAPGIYSVTLVAANAFGSSAVTRPLTVAAAPTVPSAAFTFSPAAPFAGQPVQFTDASTGATSWSWDFGDPSSGFANRSSSPNPAHVFVAPGTYAVTLTAASGVGSATRTLSLRVGPAAATARSVSLPVAGHVTGGGGVVFLTDVIIENPNAVGVTANLVFFPVGGGATSQVPLSLSARETRSLPDVVANLFGVTASFGALRLDPSVSAAAPLRMTSRTYDRVGEGSFGMAVSGLAASTSSTEPRFVTGLARTDAYRTNLGAVNLSNDSQGFAVVLRGSDGAVVGTSPAVTLSPGGQWQVGLQDLFPSAFGTGMTAEFRAVSGSGSGVPFAYASLVDNLSGDPTYFPSLPSARLLFLPVLSKVTGRGGALFESDLTVANASDEPALVTVTFWERGRDNTTGAPRAFIGLAARETRRIEDALGALFGLVETYGAARLESSAPFVASERISTVSPTTPGTVGQQVDPIPSDGFAPRASILGLRQDTAFRSNVGLVNPSDATASIGLTLRRGDGSVLAQGAVALPARGMTLASLAALFQGVPFPPGELLTLALDAGNVAISGYGIVADNVSQDLTASPALP